MPTIENRLPQLLQKMQGRVQQELNKAAVEAEVEIRQQIESGANGIMSDTGAAAASIYVTVINNGSVVSDYDEAFGEMMSAYLEKYSPEHFQERVLEPHQMDAERGVAKSAVSSASKVLYWWEYGHHNRMTGNIERAPHFRPLAMSRRHGSKKISRRFAGILKR